jgi:O-antigen ligase
MIPGLSVIRPGKLLMIPLLVTTLVALPRWQVLFALRSTVAKCVALVALLALLSIPLSVWPSYSLSAFLGTLLAALLLFIVASAGFADRDIARLCILVLVVSVGVDALYVLVGPAPLMEGRPYIGAGLDPNESAALFVFTLPFAIGLGVGRERRRWLGLAVALLLVAAVVATGSRGGVLGLLVVALILIARADAKSRRKYVAAVVTCAAVFAFAADEADLARFRTMLTPESDYNVTDREGRIQVWTRGMGYMLTHPLVGIGFRGFETAEGVLSGKRNVGYGIRYTNAHNSFVQVGAELGVIGLAAFVLAWWSAGRGCRRITRRAVRDRAMRPRISDQEARLAASAHCALLGLAATAFFLSLAYHPITLFALAVCVGVWIGSPYRDAHG